MLENEKIFLQNTDTDTPIVLFNETQSIPDQSKGLHIIKRYPIKNVVTAITILCRGVANMFKALLAKPPIKVSP